MKESQIEELEKLLHDDLLFIAPSGELVTKQMDLQSYNEGHLKILELTSEVDQLNIIDDIGVITTTITLKGSYQNEKFENKFRYIRIWKSFSDGIKIVGGSGMMVTP